MNIKLGFVYFDNEKDTTTASKILKFKKHYFNRFKELPNGCSVNPELYSTLSESDLSFLNLEHGIKVFSDKETLNNNFYLGVLPE